MSSGQLPVALTDASCLRRMGVKGAQAEAWLHDQGLDLLPDANRWVRIPNGTLIARLGRTEFFLEDDLSSNTVPRLSATLRPASGLTPVIRQDCALILGGKQLSSLLRQTCAMDFVSYPDDDKTVIMTSMIGVSVLIIWEAHAGERRYRLWCDPSFAPYLWKTLLGIAQELGGGAVGLDAWMPDVAR